MNWLIENIGSIIIVGVLILISSLIIVNRVKAKKNGKGSCGCGCSECSMQNVCHKSEINKKDLP